MKKVIFLETLKREEIKNYCVQILKKIKEKNGSELMTFDLESEKYILANYGSVIGIDFSKKTIIKKEDTRLNEKKADKSLIGQFFNMKDGGDTHYVKCIGVHGKFYIYEGYMWNGNPTKPHLATREELVGDKAMTYRPFTEETEKK